MLSSARVDTPRRQFTAGLSCSDLMSRMLYHTRRRQVHVVPSLCSVTSNTGC
jgi:hypothetical protein